MKLHKTARTVGAAGVAMLAMAGSALADGYEGGSTKDAAPAEGRKFTYSITAGATSDYIFRGISQTGEDPAGQASLDLGYGIFYFGVWGSNVDWDVGPAEIDVYTGIKPVVGPVTFDLGVIGYLYPGDGPNDDILTGTANYLELKAGASITPFTNAALGGTIYWTPELSYDAGSVWTFEGTAGYTFKPIGIFTPTINGTLGYQVAESDKAADAFYTTANGDDNYVYWNLGLALAVDKFTLDFRYWDTNISDSPATATGKDFCDGIPGKNGSVLQCDASFVFSVKVALP